MKVFSFSRSRERKVHEKQLFRFDEYDLILNRRGKSGK